MIRAGAFSDLPSRRVRDLLVAEGAGTRVTVEVTAERAGLIAGTDEAVAILKTCADDWSVLEVHSVYDGDRVEAADTVMRVAGPYAGFAHLEALVVGILSRRTRVCTNARALSDAARPKQVMVFGARHDGWQMQPGDANAAAIGGAFPVWADMYPSGRSAPAVALVPHAFIAACAGDTVQAARLFAAHVGDEVELIVPVDYENDAVRTALDVARAMVGHLWGVRIATSEHLVDASIIPMMGTFPPAGVNPQLVWNVRNALDAEGMGEVKLLVSGGFTVERILSFEDEGVATDAYGVGAALFTGRHGFGADVVERDGVPVARVGRERRANGKLERVK